MSAAATTRLVQRLLLVGLTFLVAWQIATFVGAPRHVQVVLGLDFVVRGMTAGLADAHARLNLLGFLGLTIVGVTFHFYPPAAGRFRGAGDRTALASLGLLAGGLLVEVVGLAAGVGEAVVPGRLAVMVGAVGYAYLVTGLLLQQRD